ncbi:MAG: hypothetical protein GY949_06100, partial [Gammaproteobacteria bacterium]|nr:hypothetical protein [Gammaproteobacteria bacterium]
MKRILTVLPLILMILGCNQTSPSPAPSVIPAGSAARTRVNHAAEFRAYGGAAARHLAVGRQNARVTCVAPDVRIGVLGVHGG